MFADRLSQLRKSKKKTQQEMADFLGITRPAYTAYESGSRKPDYSTLEKLADYFETTTDYLLARTDDPSLSKRKIKASDIETGGINVAYFGGAKEELTEEEAQRLRDELEMFRMLKAKRMAEKKQDK